MTRSRLIELAERCEKAQGPSRELDAEIGVVVFREPYGPDDLIYAMPTVRSDNCAPGTFWRKTRSGASLQMASHYTESVDAALTLVPKGLPWSIGTRDRGAWGMHKGEPDVYWADLTSDLSTSDPKHIGIDTAALTPALALCAAALKALAQQEPDDAK